MRSIVLSIPALGDLKAAGEYIAEDNLDAAIMMATLVQKSLSILLNNLVSVVLDG